MKINIMTKEYCRVSISNNLEDIQSYEIKENDICEINSQNNDVEIAFGFNNVRKSFTSFLQSLIECVIEFILQCISPEEIAFSDYKSTAVTTKISCNDIEEVVNVSFEEVPLNYNKKMKFGVVKNVSEIVNVKYCLDENVLKADFRKWMVKRFILFVPGLLLLAGGAIWCFNVFLWGTVMLLALLILCIVLIVRVKRDSEKYIDELLHAWKYWINHYPVCKTYQ